MVEDVVLVRTGQRCEVDVLVVEEQLEALADQMFDQVDHRGLAQIVCARLEGEAQDADPALFARGHHLDGSISFDKHTYALLARELAKAPRERILYLVTRVDGDQRITAD